MRRQEVDFIIQMRPVEIARKLRLDAEALEPTLEQLAEWGNLDRHQDHVDANSVEEFYRVKWLYQLSSRGEAAERALEVFENSIEQPGELQTEALRDIIEYLESLRRLLVENPEPRAADSSKILRQFNALNDRFEELAATQRSCGFCRRPSSCTACRWRISSTTKTS